MIDWATVVNRLRSERDSLEAVAKTVNCCPKHLRRLSRGEVLEPKFSTGIKLLDLHIDAHPELHEKIKLEIEI